MSSFDDTFLGGLREINRQTEAIWRGPTLKQTQLVFQDSALLLFQQLACWASASDQLRAAAGTLAPALALEGPFADEAFVAGTDRDGGALYRSGVSKCVVLRSLCMAMGFHFPSSEACQMFKSPAKSELV